MKSKILAMFLLTTVCFLTGCPNNNAQDSYYSNPRETINTLKTTQDKQIQNLNESHEKEVIALEEKHKLELEVEKMKAEIANLKRVHQVETENIKAKYQMQIEQLKAAQTKEIEDLRQAHKEEVTIKVNAAYWDAVITSSVIAVCFFIFVIICGFVLNKILPEG